MTEAEFVEQVRLLGINPTEEQLSKLEKLYDKKIKTLLFPLFMGFF